MAGRKVRPWDFVGILEKHKNAQRYGKGFPADFAQTCRGRVAHLTCFYYVYLNELIYKEEHKTLQQVFDLHILSLGADLHRKQSVLMRRLLGRSGLKKEMLNDHSLLWDKLIQPWPHLGHFTTIMNEVMGGIKVTKLLSKKAGFEPRHI